MMRYSVWDYELVGPNELVAMFYDKLNVVSRLGSVSPHWANLYGAQVVAASWHGADGSRPLREPQTHTYLRSVGLGGAPLNPPDARRARY